MTQRRVLSGISVNDITRSPASALSCSRTCATSSVVNPRHSTQNASAAATRGGVSRGPGSGSEAAWLRRLRRSTFIGAWPSVTACGQ